MQERQAEYLQALGVDVYVRRQPAAIASEAPLVSLDPTQARQSALSTEPDNAPAQKTTEVPPQIEIAAEVPDLAPVEQTNSVIEPASLPDGAGQGQKAALLDSPLHFIWQQQGRYLFLSLQEATPENREARLLDAVVRSISASAYSERGQGKWPLSDSQQTSREETRNFLASFIQGRSELCGTDIILLLFGKASLKHFPEIKDDFEALLGQKLPTQQSGIEELRVLPGLAQMLQAPELKVLAWQAIKDLLALAE